MGGRVEMPRALSTEQFNSRIKELKKENKPITMENIDPALWRWKNQQDKRLKFEAIALGIGIIGIFFVAIITIVANLLK